MNTHSRSAKARVPAMAFALSLLLAGCAQSAAAPAPPEDGGFDGLVPQPQSVKADPGKTLDLGQRFSVGARGEAKTSARVLAEDLAETTGAKTTVASNASGGAPPKISLKITGQDRALGREGYRLRITEQRAIVHATSKGGLHNGAQTLLQLVEKSAEDGAGLTLPAGKVKDRPRYEYRAAMLDIARVWYPVDEIKRQIDQFAKLKYNYLHLHLTNDQGWRIEIDSWPRLAEHGGSSGSFGTPGGYLTKEDYKHLVRYAADRNMTVVPEVDMPGHTTAALSSYAKLNCDGVAPPLYEGYEVGFSTLCVGRPEVDKFMKDVIREVAEMTPGPYLHIGGDEAPTPEEDYNKFIRKAQKEVRSHGKEMIGWAETFTGVKPEGAIGQYWFSVPDHPATTEAVAKGAKIIASPGDHTYLDHRYTETEPEYGQLWAGPVELKKSYEWNPDKVANGVSGSSVLGVEAPLFGQFLTEEKQRQYMSFPRAAAVAETGWTSQSNRNWDSFRSRMVEQGERWEKDGVNFYRSPQVDWKSD